MPVQMEISLIHINASGKKGSLLLFSERLSSPLFLKSNLPKIILTPKRHFEVANSALLVSQSCMVCGKLTHLVSKVRSCSTILRGETVLSFTSGISTILVDYASCITKTITQENEIQMLERKVKIIIKAIDKTMHFGRGCRLTEILMEE